MMGYCNTCKVRVSGSSRHCPLCRGDLTGKIDPGEDVFPVIPPLSAPFKRLVRFIALGTIAVAAVSAAINIALPSGGVWWSLFIIAGLGSLWLSFLVINKRWWDVPKNIFLQLFVISVMVLLWDFFTGFYLWSLNFVIPILFSCSMTALAVFARVRKLKVADYVLFLGGISVISIFSLLLIIFHVVTVVYPALVCFVLSIISLAFLILFEGKSLREELRQRMHI
jgi:hypothetical protein